MPERLSRKKCHKCHKTILVAETWPHPLERDATGNALQRWDPDRQEWRFAAWYCEPCGSVLIGSDDCYDWS